MKTRNRRYRRKKTFRMRKHKLGGNGIIDINNIRDELKSLNIMRFFIDDSAFQQLTPNMHEAIVTATIDLHNNNELEDSKTMAILFHYLKNEQVLQYLRQLYFKMLPNEIVFSSAITRFLKVDEFSILFEYINPDVNMHISKISNSNIYIPRDIKNNNNSYYTLIDLALSMCKMTKISNAIPNIPNEVADYLLEHGATLSDDNVSTILNNTRTPELFRHLLLRGLFKTLPERAGILERLHPGHIDQIHPEDKHIRNMIKEWPRNMLAYTLANKKPQVLANGLEDFDDYFYPS